MRPSFPLLSWSTPLLLALLAGCAVTAPQPPAVAPPAAVAPGGLPATPPLLLPGAQTTAAGAVAPVRAPVAAASPPPGAAAPPAPGGPPPFAVVTKDAKQIVGPITAWQKDEKLWLELSPEQFGKPFMLSPKLSTGIGEAFVLGGLMAYSVSGAGGPQLVEFVRVHNVVRLQARNTDVITQPGTPEARAVAVSYSPSLLGSAAVASQPHPESKTVLIDASTLFLSDMLGVGMQLQRAFRQGYSLDPRNSSITAVRGSPQSLEIQTQNHYYSGNSAVPQPGSPPGMPAPTVPKYVPDTRSLFVGHH